MTPPSDPVSATPQGPGPSGLLIIDKPLGLTSMTVCRSVKRRLIAGGAPKSVKVGHGGTLDPLATGVLVVLIGKATGMCEAVMAGEKRYLTDINLAHNSPTDDHEAIVVPVAVETPPTRERIEEVCRGFVGTIQQRPPDHSAMKVGGKRAYKLARAGRETKLQPRAVVVHSIDMVEYRWPVVRLDIRCGKGTYIRSLARDLGIALGTGGMLDALRRTQVGVFSIDRATALDALPERMGQADLLPIESRNG
jgi:tRNA pseudouridine55 synthase